MTMGSKFADERRARYRRGHLSEHVAAALLSAKGYRILARRYKSPVGEIDLIACRRRHLTFVEVKRRATIEACEASVTETQRRRVRRAADHWLGNHARFRDHDITFDLIFILPWHWPRHLPNAL